MPVNDNDIPDQVSAVIPSDPHGHAALLLVESLIHHLCENLALTTREAIDITERAMSVQQDVADEGGVSGASMTRAYDLLSDIAASLRIDVADPVRLPPGR